MALNFPSQDLTVKRALQATFEKSARVDHDLTQTTILSVNARDSENGDNSQDKFDNETINGRGAIGNYPPKSIMLRRDGGECAPILGYVQLGFEQRQDRIVPSFLTSGGDLRNRRISGTTPALFPHLTSATTSPARSTGTISTLTVPEGLLYSSDEDDYSNVNPVVLGDDLRMCLLTDSMTSHKSRTTACAGVFHKLPKLLRPRRRTIHGRTKKEPNRFSAYRSMA